MSDGAGGRMDASPTGGSLATGATFLMAFACGALAANLYYAQPLIGLIGPDIGLPGPIASLVVTLTQVGYGIGLILLVPLADLAENKRLVVISVLMTALGLVLVALAPTAALYLAAAFCAGVSASAVQMLVTMAASLSAPETRGRTVGNVVGGLMFGILLARPAAGLLSEFVGWRGVFGSSAVLMITLAALLWRFLPRYVPPGGQSYREILVSLWGLWRTIPLLRRRSLYHAALFADFSLFWTAVPLELAAHPFQLSQAEIALFALAGVSGALSAPLAGRLADRGLVRVGTGVALVGACAAVGLTGLGVATGSLATLVVAAIILDACVQANMVIGQRMLYALSPAIRGRLNGIHTATFFIGGAVGSALASPLYSSFGWPAIVIAGMLFPALALLYFIAEPNAAAD